MARSQPAGHHRRRGRAHERLAGQHVEPAAQGRRTPRRAGARAAARGARGDAAAAATTAAAGLLPDLPEMPDLGRAARCRTCSPASLPASASARATAAHRRLRPQPPRLPPRAMRTSRPLAVATTPIFIGAVTVLVLVMAVLLAYKANRGLPFVPVTQVQVDVPNAARLVVGNEVREGGFRIGQVTRIAPVEGSRSGAQLTLSLDSVRDADPRRLVDPHPAALGARAEVRRARPRRLGARAGRRRDDHGERERDRPRARRLLLDLRRADAQERRAQPRLPRHGARRPRRRAQPHARLAARALRRPAAGHAHAV